MNNEWTLIIFSITIVVILVCLIGTVLGISRHIDDVKRNLKMEFKLEIGKSELISKYLGKTYTIGNNEYTVVDVGIDEFYVSSGLSHTEYVIKMVDTNGFRISLNQRQFKYFIEERDNENNDKDIEQEVNQ